MLNQIKFLFFLFLFGFNANVFCQNTYTTAISKHRMEAQKHLMEGERAPLTEQTVDYVRYFKAKEKLKVNARFSLAENESSFEMPTYSGITKTFVKYGTLTFSLKGKQRKLAVYKNLGLARMPQYKNHLFLPFKDKTSNKSTYGGGRYIDLETTDIVDQKVEIDFNKSYNPWCAYGDGYNCPIPPKENHLTLAIKAGEKKFALHK